MQQKILIVDHDGDSVRQLSTELQSAGYEIISATDGSSGLAKALTESPALVIVDAVVPLLSGLDICRQLKTVTSTRLVPVIILSAKNGDQERIRALEAGAEDFISKPFHSREIVLRVTRSLARNRPVVATTEKLFAGDFEVDTVRREFRANNRPVELTVLEFKLVTLLMMHQGCVLERTALLDAVWGYSISSRTIDTHVTRLRAKLGKAAEWIETVRGVGYRLKDSLRADHEAIVPQLLAETADEEDKCLAIS